MKNYLSILILLVSIYTQSCQNDSDEPNIPLNIEILGTTPISFNTTIGQTIRFSIDNEIISTKVLEIDNHLCPSDPGINCIYQGYLIANFRVTNELESDTVIVRHGFHPFPEIWNVNADSVTTTLSSKSYRLFLTNVVYYDGSLSDKISKLIFTMQLKKL